MKIIFMNWNSYGNEDILAAFRKLSENGLSIDVALFQFDNHIEREDEKFAEDFAAALDKENPDFVMSFNFHPAISQACNKFGVKYVSWVYDNPALRLYSFTLVNPCNYVFLFDTQMYETFASQGIKTVYYMPMAAACGRYDAIELTDAQRAKWGGDVSFVGQMYSEDHNYYDQIYDKLSDYSKGYLEGLMRSQMEINGMDIVEKSIPEAVMKDMVDALGLKPSFDGVETYEYLYSNYVINRKITAIERAETVRSIGEKFGINLFTKDSSFTGKGVNNKGFIDYYNDMPYVFKASKINMNITLRSIQRGIPLRAMDVLGCGGFLLTNYQEDMLRFFVPGEDFVYYDGRQDMLDKISYYLEHEDERKMIAENGHRKAASEHTYEQRLQEMIDIVMRGNE